MRTTLNLVSTIADIRRVLLDYKHRALTADGFLVKHRLGRSNLFVNSALTDVLTRVER